MAHSVRSQDIVLDRFHHVPNKSSSPSVKLTGGHRSDQLQRKPRLLKLSIARPETSVFTELRNAAIGDLVMNRSDSTLDILTTAVK